MSHLRSTRRALCAVFLLILAGVGCESMNPKKFPNPVAGPAPRRDENKISRAKTGDEQTADASADGVEPAVADDSKLLPVEGASFTKSDADAEASAGGDVAVSVNGRPIFVDDVIESMPPEVADTLLRIRQQSTPQEFEKQKRIAASRYLQPVIERELLGRALEETMKPEKFAGLTKAVEVEFEEKELPKVMEDMGVSSRSELEVKLREQHASIEMVRDAFRNEQMARYFIGTKIPPPKKPDRPTLLKYYQEHVKDFETPAKVRWQQIVLSNSKHGGAAKTRELAGELLQKLIDGEDFSELAKKHSSGPSAKEGGTWDWTRKGSLASKEVESQLFTLPEGGVSPPIIGEKTVELVRVLERKEDYRTPFDQVQDEIEKKIQLQERRTLIGDFIKQLRDEADIEILLKP